MDSEKEARFKARLQAEKEAKFRARAQEESRMVHKSPLERLKEGTQFDPQARKQAAEQAAVGGRNLGLMARGAVKGLVGAAEQFIPPIYSTPGGLGKRLVEGIGPAAEKGMTKVGLPEPETTAEKVLTGASELIPGLAGGLRGAARPVPLRGAALAKSAHNAIIDAAKQEGYLLPGQTTLSKIGQFIGGKTPTKSAMIIRNQEVTNKIARREAGLAEDMPITEENLAAARKTIAQPYEDLRQMDPEAGRLWDKVRQVRVDARNQWKFYNSFGSRGYADPRVKARAQSLDDRAEALEDQIDRIAIKNFAPEALTNLREARIKLAKNYQVDKANTPGGDVDAKVIARDKGYKTDGLKLISDFEIERRPHFGVEMGLHQDVHFGGGIGLHHIGLGGWSRGIPLAGPVGRELAMSKLGQGGPTKQPTLRDMNPSLLFGPGLGLKPEQE